MFITPCIDFDSFLQGPRSKEFQNTEKFVIFQKKAWFYKRNAMIWTLAYIETRRKKLDLTKNRSS